MTDRIPVASPPPNAESAALFDRATRVIPGGVNSPVRAFASVGGAPYFVARAAGASVTDADGNTFVDYVQSWGASILGHAHPAVIAAVTAAAARGTTFGAPTLDEVELAEMIVDAVPGVDMVRLVSSGTEAVMTAIRLARGVTGRDRIVKFAGCYHGHSDAVLAAGGSGVATLGLPGSIGVSASAVADTLVVPYNAVPEIGDDVACVIVEPVAANMGLVAPADGFLAALRDACSRSGALLVFDEVITGFRLGRTGAAGRAGVAADLYTLGKVIGGGLPLAAVAGPRDLLGELAPSGPIYQAGTLSGNPLATAAGLAVLRELDDARYDALETVVTRLARGIAGAVAAAGVPATVPQVGTLFGIFFGAEPVTDFDGAMRSAHTGLYAPFFRGMLARGVALAPSPYEIAFVSMAHGDREVERTIDAAAHAAVEAARTLDGA